MHYDLFGFTSDSFEQFAQAIAHHVLGPGVSVFGAGPDGGREATFEGEIPFPNDANHWNGYGVLQAKYKARTEGTKIDQSWALGQLKGELRSFAERKDERRLPQYYIFVTNVVLTPAEEGGGQDQADAILRNYAKDYGLRDFRVWHSAQIVHYLGQYSELRRRFKQFIVPGDVFDSLIEWMDSRDKVFSNVLISALDSQLRAEERAKLDQGGRQSENRVSLARVFIDLPVGDEPAEAASADEVDESTPCLLASLLRDSACVLDPAALRPNGAVHPRVVSEMPLTARLIVMGGPGSGKSTVMQLFAQINRAAILRRHSNQSFSSQTKGIIESLVSVCETSGFPWPTAPRVPLRVDLSAFASALAKSGGSLSLLSYVFLHSLRGPELLVDRFASWLSHTPILLILDGLDEVPSTSNREQAINAIKDVLADSTRMEVNLLVVATSRTQGYSGELADDHFGLRYLLPLDLDRALEYVRRFAAARYGDDSPDVSRMVEIIRNAAKDELTAKLMLTPLQVTFLATLVAAGGQPPRDRWRLFNEYFETIYKREQQKADDGLKKVLDDQQTLITRVHHDLGFLLQAKSEQAAGTDSVMPLEAFDSLIQLQLSHDGWDGDRAGAISQLIHNAATDRLVFISANVARQVGFDIRSLQEYMAAERLTSGPEAIVRRRLITVATSSHWRNVFLFATGKFFARPDSEHLSRAVFEICDALNDPENDAELTSVAYSGSRLALDLLQDGAVNNTPKSHKAFLRLALSGLSSYNFSGLILRAVPDPWIKLVAAYTDSMQAVYCESISAMVREGMPSDTPSAWLLLLALSQKKVAWADELLRKQLPSDRRRRLEVFGIAGAAEIATPWLAQEIAAIFPTLMLGELELFGNFDLGFWSSEHFPQWMTSAVTVLYHSPGLRIPLLYEDDSPCGLFIRISSPFVGTPRIHSLGLTHLLNMPNPSPMWQSIIASARFILEPTDANLEVAVDAARKYAEPVELVKKINFVPWPVRTIIMQDAAAVDGFATSACGGARGLSAAECRVIEASWTNGIPIRQLQTISLGTQHRIGPVATVPNNISRSDTMDFGRILAALIEAASECPDSDQRQVFGWLLISTGLDRGKRTRWPLPTLQEFSTALSMLPTTPLDFLFSFEWPEVLPDGWWDVLNGIGTVPPGSYIWRADRHRCQGLLDQVAAAFTLNPGRTSLLRILAAACLTGEVITVSKRLLGSRSGLTIEEQLAFLIVRLCHPSTTAAEGRDIAKETAKHAHTAARLVRQLLRSLPRTASSFEAKAAFLRALHDSGALAGATKLTIHEVAFEVLDQIETRLIEPEYRTALELPAEPRVEW